MYSIRYKSRIICTNVGNINTDTQVTSICGSLRNEQRYSYSNSGLQIARLLYTNVNLQIMNNFVKKQ